jgi:hypothetical protein
MPDPDGRCRPSQLSAQTKWEIFLQITAGEITQAEAARKWQVDVSTVIGIRRTVKDAALVALARKPGRPGRQRDWQLEAARAEIAQLTRRSRRRRSSWRSCGENPVGAERAGAGAGPRDVKEAVLKSVDNAVAAGFAHTWAGGCRAGGLSRRRARGCGRVRRVRRPGRQRPAGRGGRCETPGCVRGWPRCG